jgi:sulfate/thiosulfate transport system permease protein
MVNMKKYFVILTFLIITTFLVMPVFSLFAVAFSEGLGVYLEAIKHEEALEAIRLSVVIAFIAVPINLVFGVSAAWCVAKFEFPGKSMLVALIDLPFAISPVISGFIFLTIFGIDSMLGSWLASHGIQFIFAIPAIVIATMFITLPFIARELIPVMQEHGSEEEEAAVALGASGLKTFWYITLPNIKWGILYGVLISLSRAFGEFGAVSVVSGHIRGKTTSLPMHIEILYNEYNYVAAFAVASVLAILAIVTMVFKNSLLPVKNSD